MLAAGNAYTERLFCLIQPMFAVLVFELPSLSVLNGDGEHNLQNENMFCGIAFRTHLPCARILQLAHELAFVRRVMECDSSISRSQQLPKCTHDSTLTLNQVPCKIDIILPNFCFYKCNESLQPRTSMASLRH